MLVDYYKPRRILAVWHQASITEKGAILMQLWNTCRKYIPSWQSCVSKALMASVFFLLLLMFAEQWRSSEKLIDSLLVILGTFIAAWAGGWAAFNAERKTREKVERYSRISAANKALFVIATMFNVFDNLRRHYIEPEGTRHHPIRVLEIDSPQPGTMQELHFDFDSLNFFLDPDGDECSMALMELQLLDWHYQLTVNTVELRAKALDDLHRAMQAKPISNPTPNTIPVIFAPQYAKLKALTEQFEALVDEGIKVTKSVDSKMQRALQLQFPSQGFLQIEFSEK